MNLSFTTILQRLAGFIAPKNCKYSRGEAVTFNGLRDIMIVERVRKHGKSFLIQCAWFDQKRRKMVSAAFKESELTPLNWFHRESRTAEW